MRKACLLPELARVALEKLTELRYLVLMIRQINRTDDVDTCADTVLYRGMIFAPRDRDRETSRYTRDSRITRNEILCR